MKQLAKILLILLSFSMIISSCGSIMGGSNYHATIIVKDEPTAKINYNGLTKGYGSATIKLKRNLANQFIFTVKKDGCKEQNFSYNARTFRGWAFVGSLVTWTGLIGGVYIPWGVAIDLIDGALWKPNIKENAIIKVDHKNYTYPVTYTGCPTETN